MKLGLLVSFSRRLPLELGTFSKIPTAHTRYFRGPVIPPTPGGSPCKNCVSYVRQKIVDKGSIS